MPDDREKPRRAQSQTGRDEEGMRAKRERDAMHAIPLTFEDEDLTGQHQRGEIDAAELAWKRSRRPTPSRLTKLEEKQDALGKDMVAVKTSLSGIEGQMTVWPELVKELREERKAEREREHTTLTVTADLDRAAGISDVKVRETAQLAKIEIYKTLALKVIGALAAIAAVAAASIKLSQCGGG